jgi:hypothetical protein
MLQHPEAQLRKDHYAASNKCISVGGTNAVRPAA